MVVARTQGFDLGPTRCLVFGLDESLSLEIRALSRAKGLIPWGETTLPTTWAEFERGCLHLFLEPPWRSQLLLGVQWNDLYWNSTWLPGVFFSLEHFRSRDRTVKLTVFKFAGGRPEKPEPHQCDAATPCDFLRSNAKSHLARPRNVILNCGLAWTCPDLVPVAHNLWSAIPSLAQTTTGGLSCRLKIRGCQRD